MSARIRLFLLLVLTFSVTGWLGASPAAEDAHDTGAGPAAHGDREPHGEAHPDPHGEAQAGHDAHAPHLPSFLDYIIGALPGGKAGEVGSMLSIFAPSIFGVLIAILIAIVVQAGTRNLTLIPGRLQNFLEVAIGGLNDFVMGVLGPEGRRFVPFLGTLFIYILMMNMIGLIPLMMAPTSRIHMTAALALTVFAFVQFTAIRMNGPLGYLFHLAGEPRSGAQWAMVPLMFPLHIIGELAKPFSLAVRLFGNVFGEETLIAVFVGLGVAMLAFLPDMIPLGVPIHVPFVFLSILMGSIQALVFMLLSTIYFALVMPHGEHEHSTSRQGG